MLRNYLLTAWKVFMRRKLFTTINLACIVLTLVILMVITAMLESAFYPAGVEGKSDRFLQVMTIHMEGRDKGSMSQSPLGFKLIDQYLKPLAGVERVAALTSADPVSVYQGERVSTLDMRRTDADYWKVLDFTVLAGRLTTAQDDIDARQVAVINRSSAKKLFGGLPAAAIGQKIDVGGQSFEIVGVVENALHLNAYGDLWAPISTFPSSGYRQQLTGSFSALILAHKASDLARIRREVARIASGVVTDDPAKWKTVKFWADSKLDLFARSTVGSEKTADPGATELLAILCAAMVLFMLLPALNLVNLNTGRILERQTEIGVRKAFGATSATLAGQLIVENILLCLAGGLIALGVTAGVLAWIEAAALIPYLKIEMDWAVFGYGLVLATVFGLLSGVLPAWKMSRLDPVHALKGST
ncbi:ABC transporter permease [Massilia sp. S19_KUP03_FR1]|uniref:ABC transporter permease n=1 Tax=Massilia sp. S19_KUP03_FR1 TaxID=3025503 RepID=UPI002FCCD06B